MNVTLIQLLQLMFLPFFVVLVFWFIRNRKRIPDKWNLAFNKARTVKVNMLTTSGRNIERFVKPDTRGVLHINGGAYVFDKDLSVLNAEHRIPETWFIEGQTSPLGPDFVEVKVTQKVKVKQANGSMKEEDRELPVHVLSFSGATAQKLKGKTAQEIEEMLQSKIINDIITASSKQMERIELMFYILCGVAAVTVLGFMFVHGEVKELNTQLEILRSFMTGSISPAVGGG